MTKKWSSRTFLLAREDSGSRAYHESLGGGKTAVICVRPLGAESSRVEDAAVFYDVHQTRGFRLSSFVYRRSSRCPLSRI